MRRRLVLEARPAEHPRIDKTTNRAPTHKGCPYIGMVEAALVAAHAPVPAAGNEPATHKRCPYRTRKVRPIVGILGANTVDT